MAMIAVKGYCPMGCGETLFVGDGGHVTCSYSECPNPAAVDTILDERETEHIGIFTADGFTVQHPLRERVDSELLTCAVSQRLGELSAAPVEPGRYRIRVRQADPVSESRRSGFGGLEIEPVG